MADGADTVITMLPSKCAWRPVGRGGVLLRLSLTLAASRRSPHVLEVFSGPKGIFKCGGPLAVACAEAEEDADDADWLVGCLFC